MKSAISTGFPALDAILGGGFPRGLVSEVFGYADCSDAIARLVRDMARNALSSVVVYDLESALRVHGAHLLVIMAGALPSVPKADAYATLRKLAELARRRNQAVVVVCEDQVLNTWKTWEGAANLPDAVRDFSSIRLKVRRSDDAFIARTVKNKLAPPFQEALVGLGADKEPKC